VGRPVAFADRARTSVVRDPSAVGTGSRGFFSRASEAARK